MKHSLNFRHLVGFLLTLFPLLLGWQSLLPAQGKIIDHNCTDITKIPESAINQAKATLHIGYGLTSHGSQLTAGMKELREFANNGGLGLSHPQDIFRWNNGGTDGALDLEEGDGYGSGWLDHDCGYYPDWVNETRQYLDDSSHADVNVIIWSWCGQASGRTEQSMLDMYLTPMSQLEEEYPGVTFVYMTGHADGSGETGNLHLRNQQIKNYCIANNKVLYDYYDIECYDPDGNYFGDKNVNDDCSYTGGNWAIEWQNSHTEGVDWYMCNSAHSQPLNANRKAYAAWWLWAVLAGWDDIVPVQMCHLSATISQGQEIKVTWRTATETNCAGFHVWNSKAKQQDYVRITQSLIPGNGTSFSMHEYNYIDKQVEKGILYRYKVEEISTDGKSQFYGPISVQVKETRPEKFSLFQNYPNPFNPTTTISYQLPVNSDVELSIYNISGQMLNTLVLNGQVAGNYKYEWDGSGMPAGEYFYKISTGGFVQIKKMILLK